jgi:hypothetical protein
MSPARPDEQRTRFRRPLEVAVMAYKAALGLSQVVVGACRPSQASIPRRPSRGCQPRSCARIPVTASPGHQDQPPYSGAPSAVGEGRLCGDGSARRTLRVPARGGPYLRGLVARAICAASPNDFSIVANRSFSMTSESISGFSWFKARAKRVG